MADPAALRPRLIALRSDAILQLAEADVVEPGFLALLAGAQAALAAIEAEPVPLDDAAKAERVVVVGGDGAIRVVSYTGSKAAAAVTVSPRRAIAIALSLLDLAHRRYPA